LTAKLKETRAREEKIDLALKAARRELATNHSQLAAARSSIAKAKREFELLNRRELQLVSSGVSLMTG